MNHFDMQCRQFVFSWKFNGVLNKKCPTFSALFDVSTFTLFTFWSHFSWTLSCVAFIANVAVVCLPAAKLKCLCLKESLWIISLCFICAMWVLNVNQHMHIVQPCISYVKIMPLTKFILIYTPFQTKWFLERPWRFDMTLVKLY